MEAWGFSWQPTRRLGVPCGAQRYRFSPLSPPKMALEHSV